MLKSGFIVLGAFANLSNKSAGFEYLLNLIPFYEKNEGISDVRPL